MPQRCGRHTKTTAKLPEITLTNIGEDKKGASVAETVSKVLTKILNTAYKTIVDSKIADLKNVAEENLNNVVGGVKERSKKSASLANKYKKHKIPGYFRGFFYPTELIVHKSTNTVYERIS